MCCSTNRIVSSLPASTTDISRSFPFILAAVIICAFVKRPGLKQTQIVFAEKRFAFILTWAFYGSVQKLGL